MIPVAWVASHKDGGGVYHFAEADGWDVQAVLFIEDDGTLTDKKPLEVTMREIPALYDVARQITLDAGMDWYDPRTGKKHSPPKAHRSKATPHRSPVVKVKKASLGSKTKRQRRAPR